MRKEKDTSRVVMTKSYIPDSVQDLAGVSGGGRVISFWLSLGRTVLIVKQWCYNYICLNICSKPQFSIEADLKKLPDPNTNDFWENSDLD